MKTLFLLFIFTLCAFGQNAGSAEEVVKAELSFSQFTVDHGIKDGFLEYLDTACIIFRPYPLNGREWYQHRPASKGILSWYPTRVEIAASGNFAYSTGPWEYRKENLSDHPTAYGHFFSIWKKNISGEWKVLLDVGNSYDQTETKKEKLKINQPKKITSSKQTKENSDVELIEAENSFVRESEHRGYPSAFRTHAAVDVCVYREGKFPMQGKETSMNFISRDTLAYVYNVTAGQVSSSNDLGFTYGLSISSQKDTSNFVRVWRKGKEWKIVIDILSPTK